MPAPPQAPKSAPQILRGALTRDDPRVQFGFGSVGDPTANHPYMLDISSEWGRDVWKYKANKESFNRR